MSSQNTVVTPRVEKAEAQGHIDDADRKTVSFSAQVTVICDCGNEVVLHTIQRTVVCQGQGDEHCGTEWRLK